LLVGDVDVLRLTIEWRFGGGVEDTLTADILVWSSSK
jgi:hypothetical protein